MDFTFRADDLCSKWGFGDGDMLDDWKWDREREDERFVDVNDQALLVRVVLMEVVPHIKNDLVLYRIGTIHNPLRAETVDGVRVDCCSGDIYGIEPEVVTVTEERVLSHLRWLVEENE